MNIKLIDIVIKKNFFPPGWLVGVDSQQTTRATSTSSMPLRSKQLLPLSIIILNSSSPLLCVFL